MDGLGLLEGEKVYRDDQDVCVSACVHIYVYLWACECLSLAAVGLCVNQGPISGSSRPLCESGTYLCQCVRVWH